MSEVERLIKGSPLTRPIQIGVDSYLRTKFFCIPGHVIDFDEPEQLATIQIGIQKINNDGTYSDHPEIIACPVGFAGDDVVFGHKITPGVEGLIYFSQRGVDNWMNSGGVAEPSTSRKFDITDAFFDPRFRSIPNVIQGFKNDGAWMATKDGDNYFHLKSDGSIDVKSTSTTWNTGSFDITASAFNVTTPDANFSGNLTVAQTIKAALLNGITGLIAAGINMVSHKHGGVSRGPSDTDGPK